MNSEYANFFELNGKTIVSINDDGDVIKTSDGYCYHLYHSQSCCENVRQIKTVGDPQKLIGNVVAAQEDTCDDPAWYYDSYNDSHTWTVFTLIDDKNNRVDFYWLGESNGYYSEDVSVSKTKEIC